MRIDRERAFDVGTLVLVLATTVLLVRTLDGAGTPGWDESGHAYAALGMYAAARDGAWLDLARAVVDMDYYPPLGRAALALGFVFGDVSFAAPRVATLAAFGVTLGLTALLARKLAPPATRAEAGFVAVLCGATSWLATQHARVAFLETWSALSLVAGVLAYLRALERRTVRAATLAGLALACASLVKWTHGLQLACAIGGGALVSLVLERGDRAARTSWSRVHGALALSALVPILWWFLLPLPGGLALGAEHRASYVEYLTKAAELRGLRVVDVAVVFGGMACISLPSALLQLAGIARGSWRWRDPAARVVVLVALAGFASFVAYPYRIERLLVPTSFASWALAGALAAEALARVASIRVRVAALAAGCALLIVSRGVGSVALATAVSGRGASAVERDAIVANARLWRHPFATSNAPATGPAGVDAALEFAALHLDGRVPFAWIGGTCTEIPLTLVRWRLFQERRDRAELAWDPGPIDTLWSDPGWDEAAFDAWARRFDAIVALDPPDPRERRSRAFERRFVEWLARDADFECVDRTSARFGLRRTHTIGLWRRRGARESHSPGNESAIGDDRAK